MQPPPSSLTQPGLGLWSATGGIFCRSTLVLGLLRTALDPTPRRRATRTSLSPKANARMLDPDCGHVAAMGSASACCQSSRSACLLAVINARQGLAKIPMAKGTRGQLAASSGTVRCVSRVELAVCRHVGREALVSNSKIDKKVHGAGIVGDLARVLGVVGFCL
jgi:hypothetical protein